MVLNFPQDRKKVTLIFLAPPALGETLHSERSADNPVCPPAETPDRLSGLRFLDGFEFRNIHHHKHDEKGEQKGNPSFFECHNG